MPLIENDNLKRTSCVEKKIDIYRELEYKITVFLPIPDVLEFEEEMDDIIRKILTKYSNHKKDIKRL